MCVCVLQFLAVVVHVKIQFKCDIVSGFKRNWSWKKHTKTMFINKIN